MASSDMNLCTEPVCVEMRGAVMHLTLNRPAQRNALSRLMVQQLRQALTQAQNDARVRAVVLCGAGEHFCAGADIADMASARSAGSPEATRLALSQLSAEFGALCLAFARLPLPTLALVQGSVMGGGLGLSCAADVTLARADVQFRLPETTLGLLPAQIAPLLVERMGFAQAKRWVLTAARLNATQALSCGLVHEVHADQDALERGGKAVLRDFLASAPKALAQTKALMQRCRDSAAEDLVDVAAQLFAQAVLSEEGEEGTLAFLSKRAPRWAEEMSRV